MEIPLPGRLRAKISLFRGISHFLTTNAEPYMNGAFQSPSAAEDLARAPKASHNGMGRESDVR